MASFTDNVQALSTFNPYIQQQPLEMMGKVGMYKQGQYDQGVEKIQKSFDTVAGLQVTDKHKAYLQSKLNEMGNQMKTISASDFSNSQLVNNSASQINSISNDQLVQTGVSSALRRNKQIEAMEKAREKGELTPAHQADFQQQDNAWFENEDLSKGYNATYTPFFDADKLYIENISKVLPAGTSIDYVYEMDGGKVKKDVNGNAILSRTMTRLKQEGRLPESVKAAIELTASDPRVQEEMRIRGTYAYRGATPKLLAENAVKVANENKTGLENEIDKEYLNLSLDPTNTDIQDKIANLKEGLKTLNSNLQEDARLIISNPEAVKSSLYNTSVKNSFLKAYTNVKTTQEVLKSPVYDQFWEERKFDIEIDHKRNMLKSENANSAANRQNTKAIADGQLQLGYYKANEEAASKANKKGSGNSNADDSIMDGSDFVVAGKQTTYDANAVFDNKVIKAADDFNTNKLQFVWGANFANGEKNQILLEKLSKTLGRDGAIKKILENTAKSRGVSYADFMIEKEAEGIKIYEKQRGTLGNKNPPLSLLFNNYNTARKTNNDYMELENAVNDAYIRGYEKDLQATPYKDKTVYIGGKAVEITKQNNIDLAVIAKSKTFNSSAYKTMEVAARKRLAQDNKQSLVKALNFITEDSRYLARNREWTDKKGKGNVELNAEEFDKKNPAKANTYKALISVFDFSDKLKKDIVVGDTKERARLIQERFNIRPNVSGKFFTGDESFDKTVEAEARAIITRYGNSSTSQGEGSKRFITEFNKAKTTNDIKNLGITVEIEYDDNGKETVSLVNNLGDKINLSPTEAVKFGAVSSRIIESDRAILEKSKINMKNGQSKTGNLSDFNTYTLGTTSMDNSDFPALNGTGFTAKAIFTQTSGKYFAHMYIHNGNPKTEPKIKISQGYDSLDDLINGLPQGVTAGNLQQYFKN